MTEEGSIACYRLLLTCSTFSKFVAVLVAVSNTKVVLR